MKNALRLALVVDVETIVIGNAISTYQLLRLINSNYGCSLVNLSVDVPEQCMNAVCNY